MAGQSNYYIMDGKKIEEPKMRITDDYLSAHGCRYVNDSSQIMEYSPEQISEYGYKDGRKFVSKEITFKGKKKKVFLLVLNETDFTLYMYQTSRKGKSQMFYTKKSDGTVHELKKDETGEKYPIYKEELLELCSKVPEIANGIKVMEYTKPYFDLMTKNYHSRNNTPFPYLKYGITVGRNTKRMTHKPYFENKYIEILYTSLSPDNSLSIGGFADMPIKTSDFSFHIELTYTKHDYANKHIPSEGSAIPLGETYIENIYKIHTINIPMLIRYTAPFLKVRPFANAGIEYNYNIKWDEPNFVPIIDLASGKQITTTRHNKSQHGISLGGGIEYKVNHKNSIFFDIRYTKYIQWEPFKKDHNKAELYNKSILLFSTSVNI